MPAQNESRPRWWRSKIASNAGSLPPRTIATRRWSDAARSRRTGILALAVRGAPTNALASIPGQYGGFPEETRPFVRVLPAYAARTRDRATGWPLAGRNQEQISHPANLARPR